MSNDKRSAPQVRLRALLAAVLIGGLSAGPALGRDESRRERTGDDDPVVLPIWVAAPELTPKSRLVLQDPDTTGSVTPRMPSAPLRCERVALYPERGPQDEYRAAC